MKKITIILSLILLIVFTMSGCTSNTTETNDNQEIEYKYKNYEDSEYPILVITVEDFGEMAFQLDKDAAPLTVEHIISLADNGSMEGAYFNRMQEGFVLQGGIGCTDNTTIKGEFTSNGVNNTLSHSKGVISMARSTDPDSASNQFFIVLSDDAKSSLDGSYAAFGILIDGEDVLNNICTSITSEDYMQNYYGIYMGFLNESSYIKITGFKVY